MFRFALVKLDGLETNPVSDLDVVAAPKPPVVHNPYLALHELPPLLCHLPCYQGDMQTQLGIRLLLLTGVRTGELRRFSPLPPVIAPEPAADEPEESAIQRERMEMLKIYESPHNLPVSLFAKLAGKSRDQINQEIKAGKVLTLNIGNRGQRIPDWQLEPVKVRLVQTLIAQTETGSWPLYRALVQPRKALQAHSAIDSVSDKNFSVMVDIVRCDLLRCAV